MAVVYIITAYLDRPDKSECEFTDLEVYKAFPSYIDTFMHDSDVYATPFDNTLSALFNVRSGSTDTDNEVVLSGSDANGVRDEVDSRAVLGVSDTCDLVNATAHEKEKDYND